MMLMCGLVILCRGIGKTGLPKLIHPCTSLNPYTKQQWVLWHHHSRTVQLSVVLPAIFICNAQQSGKARSKSHVKVSAKLEHEVQQVLQNYLHYTRSLPFADAKHISLYAPCFLQKLVSKINAQKHIRKALERYLLYNPINEFEPFFESIGVKASEIHRFLPPGKIYLDDYEFLLANISTLSNSGFPRHVLGKLYEEQPELFSCSAANLQKKLQFYEKLGVNKVSLIRILTCCPSLLNDDVYRKFKTIATGLNGFQVEKNKISCLMERNPPSCSSILEKLMLLAGIGCPLDELNTLYHTKPQLFINSSEEAPYSMVDFLSDLGLGKENKGSIILHYPEILSGGTKLIHRRDDINVSCAKLNNAAGSQELNISENLRKPIRRHKLNFLLKLGLLNYPEWMTKFAGKIECGSDKLQERLSCLLKLGFPFNAVSKMVRTQPQILSQSADLIQRKFDFLCSTTFNPLQALTSHPNYLCYGLEGRIKPRYKMYAWLKTSNLLKRECSFCSIFQPPEQRFVQKFVNCHPEGSKYFSLCKLGQVVPRTPLAKVCSEKIQNIPSERADVNCTGFEKQGVAVFISKHLKSTMPKTPLSIVSSGKTQNIPSQQSEVVHRRDDQIVHGSKREHLKSTIPKTRLSKVSSRKFQNILSGGSELVHRRDDLNVSGAKLKNASGSLKINISEILREPIWRHKLNFLLKLGF